MEVLVALVLAEGQADGGHEDEGDGGDGRFADHGVFPLKEKRILVEKFFNQIFFNLRRIVLKQ